MNINAFTTGNTNIFPMANSRAGGQLATEFNLLCRETVATDPDVNYSIGHSFTHSMDDFAVTKAPIDSRGVTTDQIATSSTVLVVSAGRAIVNGHYVECVTPISVDIPLLNMIIVGNQDIDEKYTLTNNVTETELSGRCCIGLHALYSSGLATYGALIPETYDEDDLSGDRYYNGIQLVVLPESQFKTPSDGVDLNNVTAHLKLATFEVRNGVIIGEVEPNEDKVKYIDVSRLFNTHTLVGKEYPSTANLDPRDHYVLSPQIGADGLVEMGWCKATQNLKDWSKSAFVRVNNSVQLQLKPKSVDGVTNQSPDSYLPIPTADYYTDRPGIVDAAYTSVIKNLASEVHNIHNMPAGKYRGYIYELSNIQDLPSIEPDWVPGDYIVVAQDRTVINLADNLNAPSTMYIVLDGKVTKLGMIHTNGSNFTYNKDNSSYYPATADVLPINFKKVATISISTSKLSNYSATKLADTVLDVVYNGSESIYIKGRIQQDYLEVFSSDEKDPDDSSKPKFIGCFCVTETAGPTSYSNPIYLTGTIGLATPSKIGGFYNFDESDEGAIDNGYVRVNDQGYLQLVDYPLLRSGLLAYQLGQSVKISAGIDVESIQAELDNYVNRRIAFANNHHIAAAAANGLTGALQHIIDVYLPLSAEGHGEINIYEIDSRFNTPVCIHISGKDLRGYTINISDCQRIRVIMDTEIDPKVNIYRSCIYYDGDIINRLNLMNDITLWYQRYNVSETSNTGYESNWSDEPDLVVDGMTVKLADSSGITSKLVNISGQAYGVDVHYSAGLYSITLNNSGQVIGAGLYLHSDCSSETSNIVVNNSFVLQGSFDLLDFTELCVPINQCYSDIKITGTSISSYLTSSGNKYIVTESVFGASIVGTNGQLRCNFTIKGDCYSLIRSIIINATVDGDDSDNINSETLLGFDDKPQIFYGGIV